MTAFNRGFLGYPRPKFPNWESLAANGSRGPMIDLRFGIAHFDWTAFEVIEFHFVNVLPSITGGSAFQFQVSHDGGASFISSASYSSVIGYLDSSSMAGKVSAATTACNLIGDPSTAVTLQSSQVNYGLNGRLVVSRPWETFNKMWHVPGISYFNANGSVTFSNGSHAYSGAIPVSGIRFFYNTGTIAQGAIYASGLRRLGQF